MEKKKVKSLAQSRRRRLVGDKPFATTKHSNIWVLRSFQSNKVIVLTGDLRIEHYYLCEGDPEVADVDFNPAPVHVAYDGVSQEVRFDTIVTFRDGKKECRDVRQTKRSQEILSDLAASQLRLLAAASVAATYIEICQDVLDANRQRILNWGRAIPAFQRCRHRPLQLLEHIVIARLGDGKATSIGEFILAIQDSPALIVAAVVSLLRKRALVSDLDSRTWGKHSKVWLVKP